MHVNGKNSDMERRPTDLAAIVEVGQHDDLCDALLPDHPPEVADGVGTRT